MSENISSQCRDDGNAIELYRILFDIAERQIDRRLQINKYYTSIIAAMLAALALIFSNSDDREFLLITSRMTSIVIFVICASWLAHIIRSRFQGISRFAALKEIEQSALRIAPNTLSDNKLFEFGLSRISKILDKISDYILPISFMFVSSLIMFFPIEYILPVLVGEGSNCQ